MGTSLRVTPMGATVYAASPRHSLQTVAGTPVADASFGDRIRSMTPSIVTICAKTMPRLAHVARCSSSAGTPFISLVAVPSLRKRTRKSRCAASLAVASQQMFVAMPEMMTVSIPRDLRIVSRSVP